MLSFDYCTLLLTKSTTMTMTILFLRTAPSEAWQKMHEQLNNNTNLIVQLTIKSTK